ncbi:hypothetical protein GBAR_LOCUS7953 [Geodia barretti]|uniref:Uncharacterized protein n=1 Tax=Geodia barretti TaxID=519541 RepID=A0AA35WCN7_GEOBA|nr:hypothetical protein GBAR_LOCUS7953 [Geodia barretti]
MFQWRLLTQQTLLLLLRPINNDIIVTSFHLS